MRLTVSNLACVRAGRTVFSQLSFELAGGHALCLRGANGAGKTSLLRLLAGLIEPAAGSIDLTGRHADLSIGQHAHFIAHANAVKPALTVAENLVFWRDYLGGGDVDEALAAFALAPLAGFAARLLSAGQTRRLALSRLALAPRALWLLDEPTVGLDAGSLERLAQVMRAHLANGGLIVAATHVDVGLDDAEVFDFDRQVAAA